MRPLASLVRPHAVGGRTGDGGSCKRIGGSTRLPTKRVSNVDSFVRKARYANVAPGIDQCRLHLGLAGQHGDRPVTA